MPSSRVRLVATGLGLACALASPRPVHAQDVLYQVAGATEDEGLGWSAAALADVDGDGAADVAFGAPGKPGAGLPGRVVLLSGRTGDVLHELVGDAVEDSYGFALAAVGDLDGDGRVELAVSALRADGVAADTGRVRVLDGASHEPLFSAEGTTPAAEYGWGVAALGDLDGDGRSEWAVSSPKAGAGTVEVRSGAHGAALWSVAGPHAGALFGRGVAGPGDVDGDGFPDLLVGAPEANVGPSNTGAAQVYSGVDGSPLLFLPGAKSHDDHGAAVAGAGDADEDGHADLLVGAPMHDGGGQNAGTVFQLSGLDGSPMLSISGYDTSSLFGAAVGLLGDVDGDGTADLAVGAPYEHEHVANGGSLRAFSGTTGVRLAEHHGATDQAQLGRSIGVAADVDGDGRADWLHAAPWATAPGAPDYSGEVTGFRSPFLLAAQVNPLDPGCSPAPLTATPPVLGEPMTVRLGPAPTPAIGALYVGRPVAAGLPIAPECALHLALGEPQPVLLTTLTLGPTTTGELVATVPDTPGVVGTPVGLQAVVVPVGGPGGFQLSNALELVPGH